MGRQLSFSRLLRLPESDLEGVDKKVVLQLCIGSVGEYSLQDTIDAFSFLTIHPYVGYLFRGEVNLIYQLCLPIIADARNCTPIPIHGNVVDLVALSLTMVGDILGRPSRQLEYKDLYLSLFPMVSESFQDILDYEEKIGLGYKDYFSRFRAFKLHQILLSFLNSQKFLIDSCPAERRLFEKVLRGLLGLIEKLLRLDVQKLQSTWWFLLCLIQDHNWISLDNRMASSQTTFEYLTDFLVSERDGSFLMEYERIQLHLTAMIKLSRDVPCQIFQLRPAQIISVLEEVNKAILKRNPQKEHILLHLEDRLWKLLYSTPMQMIILGLGDLPQEICLKYTIHFLEYVFATDSNLLLYGLPMLEFVTRSLQSDKLVSSRSELSAVIEVITNPFDSPLEETEIYMQLIGHLVKVTMQASSPMCLALKFSVLVQTHFLYSFPQSVVFTAFQFYWKIYNQIGDCALPGRALLHLVRTIYNVISGPYKKAIEELLSKKDLSLVKSTAPDKSQTDVLANIILSSARDFPLRNAVTFKNMVQAMYKFCRSPFPPSQDQRQQLHSVLEALWKYFAFNWKTWGQFQWMASFLHLLVRVSAKVHCNLPVLLRPFIAIKLPQSTTVLLILALLDCAKHSKSSAAIAERYIRECRNKPVRMFLIHLHYKGRKSTILRQLYDGEKLPSTTTGDFPHNCCERTCCFVAANTMAAGAVAGKGHPHIACNLMHAITELQRKRPNSEAFEHGELKQIRLLTSQLNGILNTFPSRTSIESGSTL